MKKRIACILIFCMLLLLAGCKEPAVPEPDKSTTTTQPTTTTTNTPVDTTTYDRVVIPITVIEQNPYTEISKETKVDGYAISLLVPDDPRFKIGETRFLEDAHCLYEINEELPFDKYIIISHYKDWRMTIDEKPHIVAYYENNFQVEVGQTKTGYPYVYYYKESPATAIRDAYVAGTLFVKVSDRYVMCTAWFNPDTLQQAHTMIDSIEYIRMAE